MSISYVLACDVGGTNITAALFEYAPPSTASLNITKKWHFDTNQQHGLEKPLGDIIADMPRTQSRTILHAVISGAGPVEKNYCALSNVAWDIDGDALAAMAGFPVTVINDYSAISLGIPVLEHQFPDTIIPLPHAGDNRVPPQTGNMRAIVGAGTGLGVGFMMMADRIPYPFPSEGGHIDFGPFDDDTVQFHHYLREQTGASPRAEECVSGPGIENIFAFLLSCAKNGNRFGMEISAVAEEIAAHPPMERAGMISHHVPDDPLCAMTMHLFVKMYGKYCGNVALFSAPTTGLYIGGGIVTRNLPLFVDEDTFMRAFVQNSKETAHMLLKKIPVFIIKEYEISIYGDAAHAIRLAHT